MNKPHAKRLLKLAAFLETLPKGKFDYSSWCGEDAPDGDVNIHTCGTTACAFGWATAMPEFRRLGLRMIDGFPSLKDDPGAEEAGASEEIFGTTYDQFVRLFYPDFGSGGSHSGLSPTATPKQVAKHIRKCVKEWTGVTS